jgi:hypothetical protein
MNRILKKLTMNESKETATGFLQIIFVLIVVGATMGLTFLLKFTSDKGPAISSAPEQVVVDVLKPETIEYRPVRTLTGQVETRADVIISPEINGRVVSLHPRLLPGGVINAGEILFSLDKTDYEIALKRSLSDVAAANADLAEAQANADNLIRDWKQVYPDQATPTLVAKEPQIAAIKARLAAANASVMQAKTNLERTNISVKNTIKIIESDIEQDQFVVAGGSYGRFFVVEALRIRVSAEANLISRFGIAQNNKVSVQPENNNGLAFETTVSSVGASLDQLTRLQPILLNVPSGINLTPGMFVKVTTYGKTEQNLYRLPATALASRTSAWRANKGILEAVELTIIDVTNDFAIVKAFDVKDGVVISQVPTSFVKRPVKIRKTLEQSTDAFASMGATQ